MKKYENALNELKKINAKRVEVERKQTIAIDKLCAMSESEKESFFAERKKQEARIAETQNKNKRLNLLAAIQKDNIRAAFLADFVPVFCEVWNKYAGKKHGEKTAQKIKDEIKNITGCYARVTYHEIQMRPENDYYNPFEISTRYNHENNDWIKLIDGNNTIHEISENDLFMYYANTCDVETRADEIEKALNDLNEKINALKASADVLNKLIPGDMSHFHFNENAYKYRDYI